ncbi:unnamed protein product [Clavelina lepadiformis]|uniref:CDAN1-interacting nuclease 1 n=1 Tax=Clavelina lepadiformis TaxID=159417 RepID=A0ABP0H4I2_CLALP
MIVKLIASLPSSLNDTFNIVQEKFGLCFGTDTLLSICLIAHQQHTKKTIFEKTKDEYVDLYYNQYLQRITMQDTAQSVLLDLSVEVDLPPALMARLVLKKYLTQKSYECSHESLNVKTELSRMMKNPYAIPDPQLSRNVRQCIVHDIGYGPVTDCIRHMVGLEYEEKLVNCVKALKIPYQDETELRSIGYDKTPDIKLQIPIAVNNKVVCWIESKASFGTPETHKQYLNDQYYSYWNRFGPGLVIYWFGFVDELAVELEQKGIFVMDNFPSMSTISRVDPDRLQTP